MPPSGGSIVFARKHPFTPPVSFQTPWPVLGTQQVLGECLQDSTWAPTDQSLTPKSVTLALSPITVEQGGDGKEEQVRR